MADQVAATSSQVVKEQAPDQQYEQWKQDIKSYENSKKNF